MIDIEEEVFERGKNCYYCEFSYQDQFDYLHCRLLDDKTCPLSVRLKDCPLPPKWKIAEVKDE